MASSLRRAGFTPLAQWVAPSRLLIWVTRLAVALLPLSQLRVQAQLTASDAAFVLAAIGWASYLLGREARGRIILAIAISSAVWLALLLGAIAYSNSVDPITSLSNALKVVFALFFVGGIALLAVLVAKDAQGLGWAYTTGAALTALSAFAGVGGSSSSFEAGGITRLAGLAGTPVGLAISSGTAVAMLVHLKTSGWRGRIVQLAFVAVNVAAVFLAVGLTGAVLASVGAIAGQLYVPGIRNFMRRAIVIALFAVGIFVIGTATGLLATVITRLNGALDPTQSITSVGPGVSASTLDLRELSWQLGWQRIMQHPFLGNGFDADGQIAFGTTDTHNFLVLSWQSGGVAMFAIAICALVASLWSLRQLWRYRLVTSSAPFAAAVIVATWFGALTSPALYGRDLYFMFAIGLGAALAARSADRRDVPEPIPERQVQSQQA